MDDEVDVRIETVDEGRLEDLSVADELAWSIPPAEDAERQIQRDLLEFDRFRLAYVGDRPVGLAGAFSFELTVPGGTTVPMGGITGVGVLATHRRRGIMTKLIDSVHADAAARNEPLTGLMASEGGIYGRFGYRPANFNATIAIETGAIRFIDSEPITPGSLTLHRPSEAVEDMVAIRARHCQTGPGAVGFAGSGGADQDRNYWKWRAQRATPGAITVLHPDGFATYTVTQKWDGGIARHVLDVRDFIAATPEAHLALWKFLCGVDLVETITAELAVTPSDPLFWLVADRRAIRVTAYTDDLWLRVVDVARCFAARSYRTDDALVVAFDDAVFRVGPDGCQPSTAEADLVVPVAEAGSLLLGAVAPSTLAQAGRIRAVSSAVLGRSDALFGWDDPVSLLRTPF